MDRLLTPAEAIALLGIPKTTFFRHQRRGAFFFATASPAVGRRKYIRAKLEEWATTSARDRALGFSRKRSA